MERNNKINKKIFEYFARRKKIGGGWECDKIGGNVSPRIFFPRGMFTFVCTHHVHAPRETEALSPPPARPSFPVELIANWFLTIEPFD